MSNSQTGLIKHFHQLFQHTTAIKTDNVLPLFESIKYKSLIEIKRLCKDIWNKPEQPIFDLEICEECNKL